MNDEILPSLIEGGVSESEEAGWGVGKPASEDSETPPEIREGWIESFKQTPFLHE